MKVQSKGKTADILLENDLQYDNSWKFVETMNNLISENIRRFNIDFKGLKYIDTYSLSNIIVYCEKPDLEFCLKNVGNPVKNILDIIKLDNRVIIE